MRRGSRGEGQERLRPQALDVIGTLREWEARFPVDSWRIGRIDVWPYLRVKLGAKLLADGRERRSHRPATPLRTAAELLRSALACARDAHSTVRRVPRADVVFLGYPIMRQKLGARWYERFFDPLADVLERKSLRCLHLEHRLDGMAYRAPRHRPSYLIRSAVKPLRRAPRDDGSELPTRLDGYDELGRIARLPQIARLRRRSGAIEQTAAYFERLFEQIRPRVAICLPYYSSVHMAFCLAARRCGVRSVDLQHGVTTRNPAYDGWTRFPESGYALLPDVFWCWSERDAKAVAGWPETSRRHHRAVVGGHPWAAFWQQAGPLADGFRQRIATIKGSRVNILVTLSWSSGLSEAHKDVLLAAPRDWTWWVRLHPSMETERRDIRRWCAEHGGGRVHVDLPTDLPLPLLLAEADAHVTRNSTVIQEASAAGLPSVVLDPAAEAAYGEDIASGWARVAVGTPAILAAITEQLHAAPRLPRSATYPSYTHMVEVLLELVSQAP